jgi:hypothetical protein
MGEEITISYIYGTGGNYGGNESAQRQQHHKATVRRQRELYAKYLFHCDCVRCTIGGKETDYRQSRKQVAPMTS